MFNVGARRRYVRFFTCRVYVGLGEVCVRDTFCHKVYLPFRDPEKKPPVAVRRGVETPPRCGLQVLGAVTLAWRNTASDIVRRRREEKKFEEELAATRWSAATLIQAVWRSHNTRKVYTHVP